LLENLANTVTLLAFSPESRRAYSLLRFGTQDLLLNMSWFCDGGLPGTKWSDTCEKIYTPKSISSKTDPVEKKTDATDIDMTSHPTRHEPFFRSINFINDPGKKKKMLRVLT